MAAKLRKGARVRYTFPDSDPPRHEDGTVKSVDVTEAIVVFDNRDHPDDEELVRVSELDRL